MFMVLYKIIFRSKVDLFWTSSLSLFYVSEKLSKPIKMCRYLHPLNEGSASDDVKPLVDVIGDVLVDPSRFAAVRKSDQHQDFAILAFFDSKKGFC